MNVFRENMLVQFSVLSFFVMLFLAVSISFVLSHRLDNNIELLEVHGATMMAGKMIMPADPFSIPSLNKDVSNLRWLTVGMVGGGFVALYVGLVLIVWKGWRTILRQ